MTIFYQDNMTYLPDHGEFLRQGGRRGYFVHKKNPRWLHINGHRSESERNRRGHNWIIKFKKIRAQIRRKTYDFQ